MPLQDENVEAVRAARESLVRKHRGLRGWFRHLQALDRWRHIQAASSRARRTNTRRGKT